MSKRKILSIITVLTLLFQILVPAMTASAATLSKEAVIADMTTEDKIAEMLMPTFRYYDAWAKVYKSKASICKGFRTSVIAKSLVDDRNSQNNRYPVRKKLNGYIAKFTDEDQYFFFK